MKNKEIEIDDYGDDLFTNEEAFKRRFRIIKGDELTALKSRIARATGEKKNRVTIYFDADIVSRFRKMSEREGVGYQTLMNDALRRIVDGMAENEEKQNLKEDLLKDKKFLKRLKTALTI